MVYESDFYTTRRPYRTTPSYSTYTVSSAPSRQVRILPGLGKVHVVHTYDRIVPYVGHKRLTVVTSPPRYYSTSQSVLNREYDWIENKIRPWVGYSATNRYLNSDSAVRYVYAQNPITGLKLHSDYLPSRYYNFYRIIRPFTNDYDVNWPYYRLYSKNSWPIYRSLSSLDDDFPAYRSLRLQRIFDDETRLIRAQTASLLKRVHAPVPRIRSWSSLAPLNRSGESVSLPSRYSNDTYIHRLLTVSPGSKIEYATYYTEPTRKFIGQSHLSCVSYAGDKSHGRRRPLRTYTDPVQNDIQLLSYYITKFRQEKTQPKEIKVPLSASRPSRIFSVQKPVDDAMCQEIQELREARAARLAKIYEKDPADSKDVEEALSAKKKKEAERLAEEKALDEEQARQTKAQAKKEEAARKAEVARQEQLAAQAAAERAADLERQAEKLREEEVAKQGQIDKAKKAEEEKSRQEEQQRAEADAKAEEERLQLLRLEEIARQAEEEKEAELARQADELAELARQEAELAELERQERELKEQAEREAELAELARQEAELAELERQEAELAELARQEAELAELARQEAELAETEQLDAEQEAKDAEIAELVRQQEELAELERQQAELDALEAEARALDEDVTEEPVVEQPDDEVAAEEEAEEEEVEEEEE